MDFNSHSKLAGQHAFLSPSNYHWVNYDLDKLDRVFFKNEAAIRGTKLHALAHLAIELKQKFPDDGKSISLYVNDAIGYRMSVEQTLYYSNNCFGSADTISFHPDKKSEQGGLLRIHDLKTGENQTSEMQLKVYAALFCLEYKYNPFKIDIELRIYQSDEVRVYTPDPDELYHIVDRIVTFDKRINDLRTGVPY